MPSRRAEGGQHDDAPVYGPSMSSRCAGADRMRVWSGYFVVPNAKVHHAPGRGQTAQREQHPMSKYGSRKLGKPGLALAALLKQKGGNPPPLSRTRARKLLATEG